jgi:hypothetical protein
MTAQDTRDPLWWTTIRPEPRPKPEPRPRKPRPRPARAMPAVVTKPKPSRRWRVPVEEGAQAYAYLDHPEALTESPLPFGVAFVYRCKDASGKVVYVGHTCTHPILRLYAHRREHGHRVAGRMKGAPWYHLMASVDWAELPSAAEAKAEERRQIRIHDPIGNVVC